MEYNEHSLIGLGKHKNKPLKDIPLEYLREVKQNPQGFPGELISYIRQLLNEPEEHSDPAAEYTPDTKLKFGKYKAKKIADIPTEYLLILQQNPKSCPDKKLLAYLNSINPERSLSRYLEGATAKQRTRQIDAYPGFVEFTECTKDSIMTFGEYEGKKIGELPAGYLFEFYSNPNKCPSKKLVSYVKRNLRAIVLEKNNLKEIPVSKPAFIKKVEMIIPKPAPIKTFTLTPEKIAAQKEQDRILKACGIKSTRCPKTHHLSRESAGIAIRSIECIRGKTDFLWPYLCERCGDWHITSISPEKWEDVRKKVRKQIENAMEVKRHKQRLHKK